MLDELGDDGLTLSAEMHAIDVDHAMHSICPKCGGNPHAFILCLNEDCDWETEF